MDGILTRYMPLQTIAPLPTTYHGGSRNQLAIAYSCFGPMPLGADSY